MNRMCEGMALIALVCCVAVYMFHKLNSTSRRWHERPHLGPKNRSMRGQQTTLDIMRIHDPESFFGVLRFYPNDFDRLLRIVGPYITKDDINKKTVDNAERSGPWKIFWRFDFGDTSRLYLATGESQKSLALNYLVGAFTAHEIIKETTWVIWKQLGPMVMPTPNRNQFEEIANGFWERWDVPNCCGALDGKLVKIKMPPHAGSDYWCYKNFHAMIMMGWADYRYGFVVIDTGSKGRQSDGGVFAHSELDDFVNVRVSAP